MAKITLSQSEYRQLAEKALRYDYLCQLLSEDVFASPPAKNARKAVQAMAETGLYKQEFLESLEKGLSRSSHFK